MRPSSSCSRGQSHGAEWLRFVHDFELSLELLSARHVRDKFVLCLTRGQPVVQNEISSFFLRASSRASSRLAALMLAPHSMLTRFISFANSPGGDARTDFRTFRRTSTVAIHHLMTARNAA